MENTFVIKNYPASLILTGALAVTAIAAAMKVVTDAQKKREEEEAQSYQQAKNQAAKLNEAEAAKKAQQWLEGQKILNALIEEMKEQGISPTEINTLKEQAATQGLGSAINHAQNLIMAQKIAELSQADMTEAQKLEAYKSTPEYIARQEALAEWYAQQQKIAELSQADMTEAQKLEAYKATPEYQARQEAELAYQIYRQGEYVSAPSVLEENQDSRPFWQSVAFWVANGFGLAQGVEDSVNASKVVVNSLDDGKVSFSGPRSIRDLFNINGTRYNPSTLSVTSAAKGIFTSAAKNGTVLFNFGVSTLVNIYDYQWGEHKDKTVISQEFGVSTVVDTVFAVGVGLLAAGVVAIGVSALVSVGVISAVVSTPALIAIATVTALVAITVGLIVDIGLDWPDQVKDAINQRIDEIQGERE